MLTISQLATYTGVTVRAIRYYHQRGVLPEPPRDQSGYRRYSFAAVIALTRIRTLRQAGVPLDKVPDLLKAGPSELNDEILELDATLSRRIDELQDTRLRLHALGAGEGAFLSDDIAAHLARLAALGLTADQLTVEREVWTLLFALYPRQVAPWLQQTGRWLDDPEIAQLYLDIHAIREVSPEDPRVSEIAERTAQLSRGGRGQQHAARDMRKDAHALRLINDYARALSPAWQRLLEVGREHLAE